MAVFKTSYNLDYSHYATATYVADGFGYVQPHAPRMIIETPTGQDGCCDEGDPRIKKKLVNYDANGNQLEITEVIGEDEIIVLKNLWDEENRLRAVDLNPDNEEHHNVAVYTYDASGQRILRHIPTRVDVYSNATLPAQKERDVTMIYPSGLITAKVINPDSWGTEPGPVTLPRLLRYTKHYYIGTERISSVTDTKSNLGHFIENLSYNDFFPVSTLRAMSNAQVEAAGEALEETYDHFGLEYSVPAPVVEGSKPTPGYTDFNNASIGRYFFHPDHLGSSSYITDKAGVVSQHMEYLPFGELLVDEHLNSHNSPFKFNAKELDPETGNYYYGARYYDPKWSIFLSVDPLAELMPSFGGYTYTFNNPLRYNDPTGMMPEDPPTEAGKYEGQTYFDQDTGATYEWDGQGAWHSDMGGENELPAVHINYESARTKEFKEKGYTSKDIKFRDYLEQNNSYYFNIVLSREERGIYNPLTTTKGYWGDFKSEFDAGWLNIDKNSTGYFWLNAAGYAIGGSMILPVASVATPTGMGGSFLTSSTPSSSITYSTFFRHGIWRLSARNSTGQFVRGHGTPLQGRIFNQYFWQNPLGQATSFTATNASKIPTWARWAIGIGGGGTVGYWQMRGRGEY